MPPHPPVRPALRALARRGLIAAAVAALVPTTPGTAAPLELTRLVDSPTAGLLEKAQYGLDVRLFADGGVATQLSAGALRRLTIGVAYGGRGILGNRSVDWFDRLEAGVRCRLVEESAAWPAVAVGYETQGFGAPDHGHYNSRSKGVFVSVSRNYTSWFGQFGVHGGANLAAGTEDGDGDVSGWLGVDKTVVGTIAALAEYDLGRSADGRDGSGLGSPLVHAGLRIGVTPQLTVAVYLKDLLTQTDADQITRELSVCYVERF